MVLVLVALLPEFAAENNFVYPAITVAAIPFLAITARRLLAGDERVEALTRGAAVAFVIYAPFEFIVLLGDWLIGVVVGRWPGCSPRSGSGSASGPGTSSSTMGSGSRSSWPAPGSSRSRSCSG